MFLSTPPSRVATDRQQAGVQGRYVSIHATLAGGDATTASLREASTCFYPRHPRGWRLERANASVMEIIVSIHATLAGGDLCGKPDYLRRKAFLSTPPSRVATSVSFMSIGVSLFLSTPPSRVATCGLSAGFRVGGCFYPRHPRGWRRFSRRLSVCCRTCFYPRHPRGWRREEQPGPLVQEIVSIHATLAGGDLWNRWAHSTASMFLSTPPSRVATGARPQRPATMVCFYPRHPRGWRPSVIARSRYCILMFLSTPPSRVATSSTSRATTRPTTFLSTPPSRVATKPRKDNGTWYRMFLSTPPSRVATCQAMFLQHLGRVSIHATLAGGDCGTTPRRRWKLRFYPRHPRGWRPRNRKRDLDNRLKFLSTPPSRVATAAEPEPETLPTFLSTPPSRVATAELVDLAAQSDVSIHATLAGGDLLAVLGLAVLHVSIHATLAGGDRAICRFNH